MAVHDGLKTGELAGDESFAVRMTLEVPGLRSRHAIEGEVALEKTGG